MPSFALSEETKNKVRILHANGRLTLGEGTSALRDTVQALVARGPGPIVLDLSGVEYVDSAGIGQLVSAYTSVTSQGGRFVLAGPTNRVTDLLQITKLYTVFEIFDTVDQATAALDNPSAS